MLRKSGNELKTDCPRCGGKLKLYINPIKRLFVCFKCDFRGRVTKELFDDIEALPQEKREITPIPEDTMPIISSPTARAYLRARHIEPRAEWLFCFGGRFADRILFPVWCYGKYWGFQGRTVHTQERVRYISSPGLPLSRILYNLDTLPRHLGVQPVYVTEGIFGSLVFENSVAAFTKRLSPWQAQALAVRARNVTIAFDKDALQQSIEAGYLLYSFGVNVSIMLMKHKGPDDHTHQELAELPIVSLFDITKHLTKGFVYA